MASRGIAILKQMGFKKPWLTSPRDFIAGVLLQNPMAYGTLCSEIVLMDFIGGHINDCWDGAGLKINLQTRQSMQSLGIGAFSPHEIGGGFIIQFDIERIRERLEGLIEDAG